MINRARTAGVRERRETPSDRADLPDFGEPSVPAERFNSAGGWSSPPAPWSDDAEERIVARDMARKVSRHLALLPDRQRQVVVMRDFEGLGPAEVCALLGISEANHRVLLHRGRSRLRNMLERELGKG